MNYWLKETKLTNYLFFNVVIPITLATYIRLTRHGNIFFIKGNITIPNFIKYNLIDGLWLYPFCCLMLLIWNKTKCRSSFLWLVTIFLICVLHELLQKNHIIKGTFDYIDIVSYFIAFLTSILFNINFKSIK